MKEQLDTNGNYIQNQFCNYEIALKLKELGFDEECLAYYTKDKEFILLSAKKRGELVGHGSVRNALFKYLKENDRTYGELFTLSNSIAAPLWQQVEQWFRDTQNYHIAVYRLNDKWGSEVWDILRQRYIKSNDLDGLLYYTYEKAREQVILETIDYVRKKNKLE